MTDHRELLELAARAMGYSHTTDNVRSDLGILINGMHASKTDRTYTCWNPLTSSSECADMCAALGIDTKWGASIVACGSDRVLRWLAEPCAKLEYRPAAWRLAAMRVAAEIGKGMRG